MMSTDDRLQEVLDGYGGFLRDRSLAQPREQPYMVRWVREFLLFARGHGGYTFEQTLDLFLAALGGRVGIQPWQIQQAADAVRIYRYQYRTPGDGKGGGGNARGYQDDHALLTRLGEVIRLRHYARSTEKTYLDWTRRLLA